MAREIVLKKEDGIVTNGIIGFSWTSLIFGMWVPFIRGDFKVGLIALLISLTGIGVFIINLFLAFFYNKIYTKNLLDKGFNPTNEEKKMLVEKEYYV